MEGIINDLNRQQKEAVLHEGSPLLILAGAGSGKTRVITRKIAYLVKEKGVRPDKIFAVTFTNKAATEMKNRITGMLGEYHFPWVGTFHSMCARILRIELPSIGKLGDFTIIDTSEQCSLLRDCFAEMSIDEKEMSVSGVLRSISFAKNHLKTVDDFASEAHGTKPQRIAAIYKLYQTKLEENNCLDFDDLIMKTVLMFKNHPAILSKYQEKFEYVLIDEYQDVNYAQYVLAKYLSDSHKNICVVGDDDQSIYGFRGSDVSIILRFENDYPGAKVIKLEENYRSTNVILQAAHAVVNHNKNRKAKKLWTSRTGGEKIGSKDCQDGRDEARFLVKKINEWMEEGEDRGLKFKDFVVLYRTNAQSRSLEEVFRQEGIPYDIVGGLKFYERAEIKDALAYLRLLINPNDMFSFRRIINVPHRGIGNVTRDKIIAEAHKSRCDILDIMDGVEKIPRVGSKIQKNLNDFSTTIKQLRKEKEKMALSDLIHATLTKVGYYKMVQEENDPRKFEKLDNLEELINDAKEFEMISEDRSLEAYLEKVALNSDIDEKVDPAENEDGKVTLMTVHSAKGLEFPVVFIVGLEEGLFPHLRSIEENGESAMEEERRLFYVAITRAKKKVYLTYARERTMHGKFHKQSPSRFLREVPEELIDHYMPEFSKRTFTRRVQSYLDQPNVTGVKTDKFRQGDIVYHKIFGKGTVEKSDKGYVTATFSTGVKILSQEYLSLYGEQNPVMKPGDKVTIEGGIEGVLKKTDEEFAYVIVPGGDVEKVSREKVMLKT